MLRLVLGLLAIFCLAGCEKQSGEAIVFTKEHIAAAPPIAETPHPENTKRPAEPVVNSNSDEQPRPIGDDEITVDGYVMKPEVRGTSQVPDRKIHEDCLGRGDRGN